MSPRKLLLTGASGRIGIFLTRHLPPYLEEGDTLVVSDIRAPEETHGFVYREADISDLDAMRALCEGIDTVLHMAADPSPRAAWESLLPRNVVGIYNTHQR